MCYRQSLWQYCRELTCAVMKTIPDAQQVFENYLVRQVVILQACMYSTSPIVGKL